MPKERSAVRSTGDGGIAGVDDDGFNGDGRGGLAGSEVVGGGCGAVE